MQDPPYLPVVEQGVGVGGAGLVALGLAVTQQLAQCSRGETESETYTIEPVRTDPNGSGRFASRLKNLKEFV